MARLRTTGILLVIAAWSLFAFSAVASAMHSSSHSHMDVQLDVEFTRPWPVALSVALAMLGIVVALVPLRRGERWALWSSSGVFVLLLVTRMVTDPRCSVVLDPHQHGCHTFLIAIVIGLVGLVLAR